MPQTWKSPVPSDLPDPHGVRFEDLLRRTEALPYCMPTDGNHLRWLEPQGEQVERHARGVRPILHARTVDLLDRWLEHKRKRGTAVERELYSNISRVELVHRLLTCRPLCFISGADTYRLRDGQQGSGGFQQIGTDQQRPPHLLRQLQSYDEMALSALLGVSVPTHFINPGGRQNAARPREPGSFEAAGVYVGLVGTRFERAGLMEWQQMMVDPQQNLAAYGYGADADPENPRSELLRIRARHYGLEHFPTHDEARRHRGQRFLPLEGQLLLDSEVYRRRLRMSIEPFLCDANDRARAVGRRAYVHMVGLGLGGLGGTPGPGPADAAGLRRAAARAPLRTARGPGLQLVFGG